jgi:hypothetical protein
MTPGQTTADASNRQGPDRWSRQHTARAFADFSDPFRPPFSQRQYAQQHGVPRATLGDWLRRPDPDGLDPRLVAFFREPCGEAFLRRLVCSILFVFTEHNACGLRQVGLCLRLAQLDAFVGSSYGALHRLAASMEAELPIFEAQQRPLLAEQMRRAGRRPLTACCDENFHGPQMCLVAVEPVSGFLLLEAYADNRDAATWAAALKGASADLAVDLIQMTTDQARGLLRCAADLEAAHSPDLFHLQHDLAGPVLLPLAGRIRQADKELAKTQGQIDRIEQACQPEGAVSRKDLLRVAELVKGQLEAEGRRAQACRQHDRARQAVRGLSEAYHPFDATSGRPVKAACAQRRLSRQVDALAGVVQEAALPERAQEAVSKARTWVVTLAACVGWFWSQTRRRVEELGLSAQAERAVYERLLPGLYWQQAAARAGDPEQRLRLAELGARLRREAWLGPLGALSEEEKEEVQRVAQECAGLFQRSSSCVEGRNGRLSLHHHGHTRLSARRLKALTVLHNYGIRRADGTTAAERFFGAKHPDLFEWLLERLPELPRPAAKRPRKADKEAAAAA